MLPALVLVADEDEAFREAVAWALRARGFRALSVASGQQALWLSIVHRVSLLVIDSRTADVDGVTVLRRLRQDPNGARVSALLMVRTPSDLDGEFATVRKPIPIEDLVRMAAWMVGAPTGPGARADGGEFSAGSGRR